MKHLIDLLRREPLRRSDPVQFVVDFVEVFAKPTRQRDNPLAVDAVDPRHPFNRDARVLRLDGEVDGLSGVGGGDHQVDVLPPRPEAKTEPDQRVLSFKFAARGGRDRRGPRTRESRTQQSGDFGNLAGRRTITYVERTSKNYEEELRRAFQIPKMIVSVSGPSKSGKTVLVTKVVSQDNLIHIYGASIKTADDLWKNLDG